MEIIARAAISSVHLSVDERNSRLRVEGRGNMPKLFLDRIRGMRDEVLAELRQGAQHRLDQSSERHAPFLQTVDAARPSDVSDDHWTTAIDGLKVFLFSGWSAEAQRLGWPMDEVFGVPPLWARVDLCGAALLIGDREVVGITPNEIRIKTPSSATLAFYRKPAVDYGVAYRARLKQVGLDASKEEFQLRSLEAVVNLYRSHHPSADVDTAKATVLDAIGARAP